MQVSVWHRQYRHGPHCVWFFCFWYLQVKDISTKKLNAMFHRKSFYHSTWSHFEAGICQKNEDATEAKRSYKQQPSTTHLRKVTHIIGSCHLLRDSRESIFAKKSPTTEMSHKQSDAFYQFASCQSCWYLYKTTPRKNSRLTITIRNTKNMRSYNFCTAYTDFAPFIFSPYNHIIAKLSLVPGRIWIWCPWSVQRRPAGQFEHQQRQNLDPVDVRMAAHKLSPSKGFWL